MDTIPNGAIVDKNGGWYEKDQYGTYTYSTGEGSTRPGVQLPSDLTGATPHVATPDNPNYKHETGSTGPGPDQILVTPNHTYVTKAAGNNQPTVTNSGTDQGDYTSVYGPHETNFSTNAVPKSVPGASQNNSTTQTQSKYDLSGLPSLDLQPGMRGADVQKLQEFLVRNGLLSAQDMATGPGVYGPKTQAAVAALQNSLGVDNSSGVGYFGPKTRAALSQSTTTSSGTGGTSGTSTTSTGGGTSQTQTTNVNPISSFVKTYTQTVDAMGLNTIKAEFEKVQKQYADLQNELSDKIADVNENPWLTEGVRLKQIERLKERYDTKLSNFSAQAKLYESLYEEGVATAKFLTTGEVAQQQDLLALAEKKAEAQAKLAEPVKPIEVSPGATLYDPKTGKALYTAPTTKQLSGTSGGSGGGSGGGTNTTNSKGRLSNTQFVELSLQRAGLTYDRALSQVPQGKVGVVDNATGAVGYIDPLEFNTKTYTYL